MHLSIINRRFFVDEMPIRVFKNNTKKGVAYPSRAMQIIASLWDGSNWATDRGKAKVDCFEGFGVDGCPGRERRQCSSPDLWWNDANHMKLSQRQEEAYKKATAYISYDYCSDRRRYPTPPPECPQ